MATKEQERKALAQIMKIVQGVGGNDSYIGMAFEGCFDLAESNIEYDFGDSMKSTRDYYIKQDEMHQLKIVELSKELNEVKENNERLQNEISEINRCSDRLRKSLKEANDMAVENWNKFREQEDKVAKLEQEIIRLKARLFDMMEAQGA